MGSIPAFHAQATQDAEARLRAAMGERDKAQSFLEALDELLGSSEPRLSPSAAE